MTRRTRDRVVGGLFLAQFAVVCIVNLANGTPAEIWWLSHVCLALAGIGLIAGRLLPVVGAIVAVAALHAIWLMDCFGWWLTGGFPFGVTTHLADADAWRWVATLHHFYFVPLLLIMLRGGGACAIRALPIAVAAYAVLTIAGRIWLPRAENVNYAFMTGFDHPIVWWGNGLAAGWYLLGLNLVVAVALFFPTAAFLDRWLRTPGDGADDILSTAQATT